MASPRVTPHFKSHPPFKLSIKHPLPLPPPHAVSRKRLRAQENAESMPLFLPCSLSFLSEDAPSSSNSVTVTVESKVPSNHPHRSRPIKMLRADTTSLKRRPAFSEAANSNMTNSLEAIAAFLPPPPFVVCEESEPEMREISVPTQDNADTVLWQQLFIDESA